MPIFVDRSGQLFEGDADPRDLAAQGIREASDEDIARHNEAIDYEEKSALGKAGELAVTGLQGAARGAMAPGLAIQQAITGKPVDPEAGREQSALSEGVFEPSALRKKERHPLTAGVGEATPSLLVGAATGGMGTGLAGGAAALGADAAFSGLSQEAIDSVIAKRDFSATSALWNGVLDLAFGAVGYGAGRALPGWSGADELGGATRPPVRRRNWLGEVDKGPLPTDEVAGGMGMGARAARSAGAAGEDFTDDVWDQAVKSLDDANGGKGLGAEAQFLAKEAEPLTDLAAVNMADNINAAMDVVKKDISESVRVADVEKAAGAWTDDMLDAQDEWVSSSLAPQARQLADVIQSASAAAKKNSGQGFDAGGFSSDAVKSLTAGAARVQQTRGARRLMAVVNLKREIDRVTRGVQRSRTVNEGSAGQLIAVLNPFADGLRKTIREDSLWGKAAPMMGALDDAWHEVIEPLSRFQDKLTERLGDSWAQVGQEKINRRARVAAIGQMLRSSAANNREFFDDIQGALGGLERLGEARVAHGLTQTDQIPRLFKAVTEIKQDLNMSDVIGVAKRKASEAGGGIGGAAVDAAADFVGGKVPLVGGAVSRGLKGAAKRVLNAPNMPAPGTPLRKVLDARLKAYSRSPDLANAGYAHRLPDWLRKALKAQGGQVAGGAAVVGALGALSGEAGAAELTPEQQATRQQFEASVAGLTPEQQQIQVRTVEGFGRLGAQTTQRVRAAVSDLFGAAMDPEKPRPRSAKLRALDKRAEQLGTTRSVARFMGRQDDLYAAFKQKSQLISSIMLDPGRLARSMAENLGDLPELQPEIFAKMVMHTYRTAAYLHQTRPGNAGKSILNPEGYPATDEEIEEWAGRWSGALQPLDAIEDLAANDLQPEQIEAVKANWPDAYVMFQQEAMQEIALLGHRGKTIPQQALEQLDTALSLDGAGDPVLSWGMADLIAQAEAMVAQKAQEQPGAPPQPMNFQHPEQLVSSSLATLRPQ